MKADLLFELGTEELPARLLTGLESDLLKQVTDQLTHHKITFGAVRSFSTPRRLAVYIQDIPMLQPAKKNMRWGPFVSAAYDGQRQPTAALKGFLRSVNAVQEDLIEKETPKGFKLVYYENFPQKYTFEVLPDLLYQAVHTLHITKPMRWGKCAEAFIRPVRWVLALFDDQVLPLTLFGKRADRLTCGHRFMGEPVLSLAKVQDYEGLLEKNYVLPDRQKRKAKVIDQIKQLACKHKAQAHLTPSLLEEVTGLVEWPVALMAGFDPVFLSLPKEILIAVMEQHQKSFALLDAQNELRPYFIFVSNMESTAIEVVMLGNQKVMKARLSDAQFFYKTDRQKKLYEYGSDLSSIIVHPILGTLFNKVERLKQLALWLPERLNFKEKTADLLRAATLCKLDLVTQMVLEFPELQGTIGAYYAKEDGESSAIAFAIREHYHPRFSGDTIPFEALGIMLALADKMESLCGLVSAGEKATGEKDPFSLRRMALGIIRILIEGQYALNLRSLLDYTFSLFDSSPKNENASKETESFILERLKFYYKEQGITANIIESVLVSQRNTIDLYDIHIRLNILNAFLKKEEALILLAMNKRIAAILEKAGLKDLVFDPNELREFAEKKLWEALQTIQSHLMLCSEEKRYEEVLFQLLLLKDPVNHFFDQVTVNIENSRLKENRLALLKQLHSLFLQVADFSLI